LGRDESFAPTNPPTANDDIAIVNYRGLSRCDRALRFVQSNSRALIFKRRNRRGSPGMAVANLYCDFHVVTRQVAFDPVRSIDLKFVASQIVSRADNDAIRFRIKIDNVMRSG